MKFVALSILAVLICVGLYGLLKPLPPGVSIAGTVRNAPESSVHFLEDRTYTNQEGAQVEDQEIFDEALRMVRDAHSYILVDMFFYSDFLGTQATSSRALSEELTSALITKKKNDPSISIQVITDPINTMYGGYESLYFARLADAGIPVTITNLTPLRDSNPLYSAVWRTALQWFGVSSYGGWLPNLLDERKPPVTLRAYLASFNFKANHRKVLVVDSSSGFSTLVTSANPHDGSSANSNTALRIDGAFSEDVIAAERSVVQMSGGSFIEPPTATVQPTSEGSLSLQLLTERKIEYAVISEIDAATVGDTIDLAMFYLSDREILKALKRADSREVTIRLILDPNKDAFGRQKDGVPNRPVAHELMSNTHGHTTIRWCDTRGEQCHTKMLLITKGDVTTLVQGSANYTRRNLDDFNLEANVRVTGPKSAIPLAAAQRTFDALWTNADGKNYSVPYAVYADTSLLKTSKYRIMEFLGTSRF